VIANENEPCGAVASDPDRKRTARKGDNVSHGVVLGGEDTRLAGISGGTLKQQSLPKDGCFRTPGARSPRVREF
jgi:hypothetical protein